jgi:transposase
METSSIEYAAYVGLDWADREHAWCLQLAGHTSREAGFVAHTPEAIEQWAAELAHRFQGRPVAVALEQSRGALLFALTKYEHLILYPIHPGRLAHYRKSFRPSGAKDDPSDAELLLNYLSNHRDQARPLRPDTEETRALQFLVEARRRMVDDKTRFKNRLTAVLKQYYPQILGWFADVDSVVVIDILERWPTLEDLQCVRRSTLDRFLKQHRCGDDELWQKIHSAVPATKDPAVLRSFSLGAKCLVRLLREMRGAIEDYDRTIADLAKEHPDFDLFESFPGAGDALVPRLIAAFGSQRDRWANASELQCYAGIAPVLETSGRQKWVHVRWACPKFVRQTFHEWALHSLKKCTWAKEHYQAQLDRGKSRHAAIRAVAFKWLRIAFRCWKSGSHYSADLYLQRRSKRAICSSKLEFQWKTCGSFFKVASVGD